MRNSRARTRKRMGRLYRCVVVRPVHRVRSRCGRGAVGCGRFGRVRVRCDDARVRSAAATVDTGVALIYSEFAPCVPVSSRGQDTWFSATGPGFESPYRYQPSPVGATAGKPTLYRAAIVARSASISPRRIPVSSIDRRDAIVSYRSEGVVSMPDSRLDLPQGTLDLLVLKTLALEPRHGWAISERLHQISRAALTIRHGSLSGPASLERRGWIKAQGVCRTTIGAPSHYTLTAGARNWNPRVGGAN